MEEEGIFDRWKEYFISIFEKYVESTGVSMNGESKNKEKIELSVESIEMHKSGEGGRL